MYAQRGAREQGLASAAGTKAVTAVLGLSRLLALCPVRSSCLITWLGFPCQVPQTAGFQNSLKSSRKIGLKVPVAPAPCKSSGCPGTFAPHLAPSGAAPRSHGFQAGLTASPSSPPACCLGGGSADRSVVNR